MGTIHTGLQKLDLDSFWKVPTVVMSKAADIVANLDITKLQGDDWFTIDRTFDLNMYFDEDKNCWFAGFYEYLSGLDKNPTLHFSVQLDNSDIGGSL